MCQEQYPKGYHYVNGLEMAFKRLTTTAICYLTFSMPSLHPQTAYTKKTRHNWDSMSDLCQFGNLKLRSFWQLKY
jgi:hypothetical protein